MKGVHLGLHHFVVTLWRWLRVSPNLANVGHDLRLCLHGARPGWPWLFSYYYYDRLLRLDRHEKNNRTLLRSDRGIRDTWLPYTCTSIHSYIGVSVHYVHTTWHGVFRKTQKNALGIDWWSVSKYSHSLRTHTSFDFLNISISFCWNGFKFYTHMDFYKSRVRNLCVLLFQILGTWKHNHPQCLFFSLRLQGRLKWVRFFNFPVSIERKWLQHVNCM